jgi:hypothetical protein
MSNQVETFRSKLQSYKDCPRKRWLSYEFPNGTPINGIRKVGFSRYLLLGSGVHEALRLLLTGQGTVDEAAAKALSLWDEGIASQGLSSPDGKEWVSELYEWIVKQDRALLEGIVRGFGLYVLPLLLDEFNILEAEVDRVYEPEPGFKYIVKLDALMERKTTEELFVMSFKSYAWWGDKQQKAAQVDDQNYGEPWGMEGIMRGWWQRLHDLHGTFDSNPETNIDIEKISDIPEWFRNRYCNGQWPDPPTIAGVMMGILRKGQERKNEGGTPIRYSPWVRGYYKEGEIDIGTGEQQMEWAWSWDVPKVSKDGNPYKGTLGKGWTIFQSWDHPQGVKGWVEQLASGQVQPEVGDVMAKQFEFAEPHLSKDWEKERWARQIIYQEKEVAEKSRKMRELWLDPDVPDGQKLLVLDWWFPQNTRNCYDFNSQCGNFGICFGDRLVQLDPLGTGVWKARESHHEEETGEGEE